MSANSQHRTTRQLAEYLNRSEATIKSWRRKGIGPPWFRTSDSPQATPLYPNDETDAWREARMVRP